MHQMAADRPLQGVAPSAAMDHDLLPRPTLPIGATGVGADGAVYEILATIERGGMGELFLARTKPAAGRVEHVVLKRLLADLLEDDKYINMFRSEAQVMAELDHPNIVRVTDMPTVGGTQCLAMEYVHGRNVQQILSRCMELGTHMPPPIVLGIMREVLLGLDYAHRYRLKDGTPLNLVHRDVTPGNVLVSFSGDVKLTDFGIAKSQMSLVSTTVGIVKGKARYLSPEQILGETATPRSDLFSSAAVTCEMLSGVPAFDRGSVPKTLYAIVNGEIPDLDTVLPFRAPLLVQTLRRALETQPDRRMQTAAELAEALEASARLFGPPAGKEAIGAYVSELFRDVYDPLADVLDEDHEAETVHGFRPLPVEEAPPERPAPNAPTALREGRRHPPPIPPGPFPGTDVSDLLDSPPDAAALAAQSAYASPAAGPTQIVRGTPINPPSEEEDPDTQQAVDEALSVLAWLQTRQDERRDQGPLDLGQLAADAARERDDTRTTGAVRAQLDLRPEKRRAALLFGAGLLAGVLLTVLVQALFSSDPEPPAPEPVAARTDSPDPELEPQEEPPLEADLVPPTPSSEAGGSLTLDVLYPRGARVRLNGELLQNRVPIRGINLAPGEHSLRVVKGRYRREVRFEARGGERWVMAKRLRKK